jgi:hypothetical protein
MKLLLYLLLISILLFFVHCSSKSEHTAHDHSNTVTAAKPNDTLYDEVMKIHDEVMPKMNDIYKLKEALKKQMADSPTMIDSRRKEIEAKITNLETAGENMMQWMREFNPPADSLGKDTQREYLEQQLESVQKVKESILFAIEPKK